MSETSWENESAQARRAIPQTFHDPADRARLTPAALEGICNLIDTWALTGEKASALLGISTSTWDRIKAGIWQGKFPLHRRLADLVYVYGNTVFPAF